MDFIEEMKNSEYGKMLIERFGERDAILLIHDFKIMSDESIRVGYKRATKDAFISLIISLSGIEVAKALYKRYKNKKES